MMLNQALEFILHLNIHLATLVSSLGLWFYVLLFAVIFAETGLVITSFLPGDSLLFATGSLAAISSLHIHILVLFLIIAAFLGNFSNYLIGCWFGKILIRSQSNLLLPTYLNKAHAFYEKHGAIAVIISRFIPIIRTFIPFIAGMAKMDYRRFMLFNAIGAFAWITLLVYAGYFFGQIPFIKQNFSWVVLSIILISLIPIIIEILRYLRSKLKIS